MIPCNGNYHEMNVDWLICRIKEALAEWTQMEKEFADLNEAFNDLKKYVTDYFNNLDVQDEINNKLEEMFENGDFETVFNALLSKKLLADELDYQVFAQHVRPSTDYSAQGAVFYMDSNKLYCLCSHVNLDNSAQALVKINLSDMVEVSTSNKTDLAHCNDIERYNNKFYICANGISELNDNLSDSNVYELDITPVNIADVGNGFAVCGYDTGNNYHLRLYTYDFSSYSEKELVEFEKANMQGAFCDDLYYYIIYTYSNSYNDTNNFIAAYSKDLSFIKTIKTCAYTEFESASVLNNTVYISSNCAGTATFFRGSLRGDTMMYSKRRSCAARSEYPYSSQYDDYYVNSEYDGIKIDNTENAPFSNVIQALNYMIKANGYRARLNILNDYTEIIYLVSLPYLTIVINGNGFNIRNLTLSGNVILSNVKLNGAITGINLYNLHIDNSEITLLDDITGAINIYLVNSTISGSHTINGYSLLCDQNSDIGNANIACAITNMLTGSFDRNYSNNRITSPSIDIKNIRRSGNYHISGSTSVKNGPGSIESGPLELFVLTNGYGDNSVLNTLYFAVGSVGLYAGIKYTSGNITWIKLG